MKKHGFTLAEVLITLGIIGVITALTIPTFISNVQNASNGSRLASTVSTLENAFTTMILKEDAETLFETEAWENQADKRRFASIIGDYLSFENFRDISTAEQVKTFYNDKGPYVLNSSGSKNNSINDRLARLLVQTPQNAMGNHVLELKNGATVFLIINQSQDLDEATKTNIRNQGGSLYNEAADVWIDVNGTTSPNTLGRDIFGFYLDEGGNLYPLGGKDVAILDISGSGTPQLWNGADSNRKCLNGNIADGGYGCAARVVADGYKINY